VGDPLEQYRSMRDFEATPEPAGVVASPPQTAPRFVVQEHHATALHWDLRLERDGVLASWAVPKGLPVDPKTNHLAVRTEDHPMEYLEFEGTIPEGHYGAGIMGVWDRGTYECHKWDDREVMVTLLGERIQGRYVLFRTGREGDRNWMIHRMDPPQDPTREVMPAKVAPMFATPSPFTPDLDGRGFAYEIKWDGVRAVTYVDGGRIRIETRNGIDATKGYPELRDLGRQLGATPAILDGEIVALDAHGHPSFELLQRRMHVQADAAVRRLVRDVPIVYMLFDVLWLDGHSTLTLPYSERRRVLEGLNLAGPSWQTPAYHAGDGAALLTATREQGLEGIVAKRMDCPYEPGKRVRHWLKIKNQQRQEFVVGGWLPGEGGRGGRIGALLLGYHDQPGDDTLHFAGRVGTGFSDAELDRLASLFEPIGRDSSPFSDPVPHRDARFVEPRHVAEVRFTEWTRAGVVRHPVYKGLRDDTDPNEVVREIPAHPEA
jgi:bifunctional non-homologous end joining protein LigD